VLIFVSICGFISVCTLLGVIYICVCVYFPLKKGYYVSIILLHQVFGR